MAGLRLPGELVPNHLDVDLVAHAEPHTAHEVLVDPWLEFAHPVPRLSSRSPNHPRT